MNTAFCTESKAQNTSRPSNPSAPIDQDPDDLAHSPQLKTEWDQWHLAVHKEIGRRWYRLVDAEWHKGRRLLVIVSYDVERSGSISNIKIEQSSTNANFDALAQTIISGLAGSEILRFPILSRRTRVEKSTTLMGVESRSIAYSDFDFARIFVDDPHNGDRNKGVLALDHSGRPAVYLFFDGRNPCVMLSQHSLPDILAHWTPSKVEGGVYSFSFFCYSASDRTWKPVQVDLQFHDNYCDRFRVVSDETKIQNWLSAEVMPMQGYGKNVKRDIFFGLIEGPRDTTDCGILLIPEKYWKAVKNGRCPLTFSN